MDFIENKSVRAFIILPILFGSCHNEIKIDKPNIILILSDDLGWADVGYNGAGFYETPNINELAAEGMVFNRFLSVCSQLLSFQGQFVDRYVFSEAWSLRAKRIIGG